MPFHRPSNRHLALLLVGIGALGTPVRLAKLNRVWDVLRVIGVSPAPSPYTAMTNDGLYPLGGVFYRCIGKDGQSVMAKNDYELRNRVPGPHGRTIVYLVSNSYAMRRDLNPMIRSTLRYAWCDSGPLATAAGCPADVQSVEVSVRARNGSTVLFQKEIPCQL